MPFISTLTQTSTQIATDALTDLQAASVDGPPSAPDLTIAIARLDQINQKLAVEGIYTNGDLDATPSPVALYLRNLLVLDLMPTFGQLQPPPGIRSEEECRARLRLIGAQQASYGPQAVSFF